MTNLLIVHHQTRTSPNGPPNGPNKPTPHLLIGTALLFRGPFIQHEKTFRYILSVDESKTKRIKWFHSGWKKSWHPENGYHKYPDVELLVDLLNIFSSYLRLWPLKTVFDIFSQVILFLHSFTLIFPNGARGPAKIIFGDSSAASPDRQEFKVILGLSPYFKKAYRLSPFDKWQDRIAFSDYFQLLLLSCPKISH